MRAKWEVGLTELDAPRLMTDLANQGGGTVDTLHSVPAVHLPDDSFLIQFPGGVLGAMAPGNRQQASYWISRPNRGLSPYLREAIHEIDSHAIIMALDLNNAFSSSDLERGIEKFETVQKSQLSKAAVAKLMASVQGVTLAINFRDKPYGRLSLDFAEDAALVSSIAKPLMLEILGSYCVMVDDAHNWTAEVKGNQMSLAGSFTKEGLMQVSSLIRLPSRALHAHANASSASGQKASPLELTQQYLASVESLLKILGRKKHDMVTLGQFAQWLETYGRKLDHLPTLGVDKEMLQYGRYVSQQLHHVSFALKGIGIQEPLAESGAASSSRIYGGALGNISQDNWQSGGYYGGGGGANYGRRRETNAAYGVARHLGAEGAIKSGMRQAQSAVTTVRFQSRAQAANYIQQAIANIETADIQIREAMTDKYQVQF
jgi:hypothetical protein